MSNIFKSSQCLQHTKRVIKAKPIPAIIKADISPEITSSTDRHQDLEGRWEHKKVQLEQHIQSLKSQALQLQEEIEHQQKKAREEIELWWNEKKLEAARLEEERAKKGYEEGYQRGYQQAEAMFEEKMLEVKNMLQLAYQEKGKIIQSAEPYLLTLSVKIAEKVLHQELELHPDQMISIVKKGLKQVTERGEISIQVSPQDYTLIAPYAEELEQLIDSSSELRVIPDHLQNESICLIHTNNGSYDVSIDSQLQEIRKHLLTYHGGKLEDEN